MSSTRIPAYRTGPYVVFPDGTRVDVRYDLLDVARLQPSHLVEPVRGAGGVPVARRNPVRRGLVRNTREYEGRRGRHAAELVFRHMQADALDPDHLLDATRFVTTGPPLVSLHVQGAEGQGIVIAGNHRASVLRGAARTEGRAAFDAYRAALLEHLSAHPHLGIPASLASQSPDAVLVRVVADEDLASDLERLDYLNVVSDWSLTKAMDPTSLADAMATGLRETPRARDHLAATFTGRARDGSERTLAGWLNSDDAVTLVREMAAGGAISPMVEGMLVHPKTRRLSVHGRHMVAQMLYAAAVENAEVLDLVSLPYLQRIEPALPVLATSPDTPAWRAMREATGAALEYFRESIDVDELGRLVEQDDLFGGADPVVRGIAHLLHYQGGDEFAARLRVWAAACDAPATNPTDDSFGLFQAEPHLGDTPAPATMPDPGRLMVEHFANPLDRPPTARGLARVLDELRANPKAAAARMRKLVPDDVWARYAPRLDPPRPGGRKHTLDRGRLAALVLLRRSGVPWRQVHRWWPRLPTHETGNHNLIWHVGSYSGCMARLSKWRERDGGTVWDELCRELRLNSPS